jgi:hypothetical protein
VREGIGHCVADLSFIQARPCILLHMHITCFPRIAFMLCHLSPVASITRYNEFITAATAAAAANQSSGFSTDIHQPLLVSMRRSTSAAAAAAADADTAVTSSSKSN